MIFHWCHSSAERQFVRTVCAYRACRQPELGSGVAVHCRRHPEACASCSIARNGALRRSAHYMSTTSTHPPHISCEDEEDGADARASERRPSKSYPSSPFYNPFGHPAKLRVRCRGVWHVSSRLWDGWIGYTGGSGGQQPLIFDIHGEPLGRWWVPHGCHCGATLRPMSAWETVDANASEAKGSCYGMLTPHPVGLKTTPCRQRSH